MYYFIYIRTLYHFEKSSELDDIELLFEEYYKDLSILYGPKSALFTVHLHSHLKDQVLNHGALSMTSCFARESYLGLALTMCHGKKYILEQYITWHLIDRSLYDKNTVNVDDIFITERYNGHHININIINKYKEKLFKTLTTEKITNDRNVEIRYYSRYHRGFKSFHSIAYSRTGKAISYQVSVVDQHCIRKRKRCFADVIFYFKLNNNYYAFLKHYRCIDISLNKGLTTILIPQNIIERLGNYYGLFNIKQYCYKVVPVIDVMNKVIKMKWNENNIFVFTEVVIDWEHD